MQNSHYVPRMTLRKFGEKLCLYNVKTGEYKKDVKTERAFSQKDFYDYETEINLNKKIESQFGNLFSNKILKGNEVISLSRDEVKLIKKYLLISTLRAIESENYVQKERMFYNNLRDGILKQGIFDGFSKEQIEGQLAGIPPFQEKIYPNEAEKDYWLRTLNVILDTDGSPEEIMKHPDKTYPAYRWAEVISYGYLAFWDSEGKRDEYLITDIGMTSENELGWNGVTVHNTKKTGLLRNILLSIVKETEYQHQIANLLNRTSYFSENFMMFPISAKRMIVEISPFYKFRWFDKIIKDNTSLKQLTKMDNENLFKPNDTYYVKKQTGINPVYHPDDRYIYEIKKLNSGETRYCNELFLDRINTWVGFSSLNKAVGSIVSYKKANSFPYVPRVDYTDLYKIIEKRYAGDLNV